MSYTDYAHTDRKVWLACDCPFGFDTNTIRVGRAEKVAAVIILAIISSVLTAAIYSDLIS